MQTVSNGDSLHEKSNPAFWEKQEKNIISLSSAEFAQRVTKVKKCWMNSNMCGNYFEVL